MMSRPLPDAAIDEELSDARRGARHKAVLLACRLIAPHSDDLCLVRDISALGARAQTGQKLAEGDHVVLEFGNLCRLPGTVRWTRECELGVEFDHVADLHLLLEDPGQIRAFDGWKRRKADTRRAFPRFRRCAVAAVSLHGLRRAGRLHDLSPAGAAIDLDPGHGLKAGDWVLCEIAGVAQRAGTIRWAGPYRVGLSFDIPLPLRLLDDWVIRAAEKCSACPKGDCPAPSCACPASFDG